MKWLTRSVVPSMAALAALIGFLRPTGPTIELTARDNAYSPARLVVHVGDSISFRNTGRSTHTFDCPGCGVSSGNVQPGTQKALLLSKPGTFVFSCLYHGDQGMRGTIVVLRPGEPTPAATAASPGA